MSQKPVVASVKTAEKIYPYGDEVLLLVPSDATDDRFCLFRQVYDSQDWSPLHLHEREAHFVQLISGTMEFEISDALHSCGTGDGIYMPSNQWHRFRAVGDESVHMLVFNLPGGFDRMYGEIVQTAPGPAGERARQDIQDRYGVRSK